MGVRWSLPWRSNMRGSFWPVSLICGLGVAGLSLACGGLEPGVEQLESKHFRAGEHTVPPPKRTQIGVNTKH